MAEPLPVLNEPRSALRSDGGRNFVIPADVSGRFNRLRRGVFALLIVIYAALPWVEVGGHPAVFLDIQHRAFYLFGATFNAQDFWLAFFVVSAIGFALIVVAGLFGRVWCGYACPQTVFLDGVFRRIERLIEGTRGARLKRDRAGFSWGRAARKTLKHLVFFALAFLVAHIFLSYFVSLPALFQMVRTAPAESPEAFAWAFATTLVMYVNFAWFREQLCIVICPYGRLQSVLSDPDTLVIGYDLGRGEPRGKAKAKGAHGDCVDCGRCVVVCPTGIDIRHGLQLDCIGCAACVDACDEVMDRLKRPRGLVRYDSLNGLLSKPKRFLRPRAYLYLALGALGLGVAAFAMTRHVSFEANLLRLSGAPYVLEGSEVRNVLELHLVNKRSEAQKFLLEPEAGPRMRFVIAQPEVELSPLSSQRIPIFVFAPNDHSPRKVRIRVDDGVAPRWVESHFVAP